jgi:hypothetical protein
MKKIFILLLPLCLLFVGCKLSTSNIFEYIFNFEDPVDTAQKADAVLIVKVTSTSTSLYEEGGSFSFNIEVVQSIKNINNQTISNWIVSTDTPGNDSQKAFNNLIKKNHYYFIAGMYGKNSELGAINSMSEKGIELPSNFNPNLSLLEQDDNVKDIYLAYIVATEELELKGAQ